MTPRGFDPATIVEKLRLITDAIDDLEGLGDVDAVRLGDDRVTLRVVERCLAHVVDVAAQVNAHAAATLTGRSPRDLTDSFDAAATSGVIGEVLAAQLRPSAGMRNVIVHAYDDLDLARVASTVPLAIDGYREYVRQVAAFLDDRSRGGASP